MIIEIAVLGILAYKTFLAPAKQVYAAGVFAREKMKQPRKMSLPGDGKIFTVEAEDYLTEDGELHSEFGIFKMVNGNRVVLTQKEAQMIASLSPSQTKEFLEEIGKRKSRRVEER